MPNIMVCSESKLQAVAGGQEKSEQAILISCSNRYSSVTGAWSILDIKFLIVSKPVGAGVCV